MAVVHKPGVGGRWGVGQRVGGKLHMMCMCTCTMRWFMAGGLCAATLYVTRRELT